MLTSVEDEKKDIILTGCRIHKSKGIENAVKLAKQLKEKIVGDGMKVFGNISSEYDWNYYLNLKKMVRDYELEDYVTFETSVNLKVIDAVRARIKNASENNDYGTEHMLKGIIFEYEEMAGRLEHYLAMESLERNSR